MCVTPDGKNIIIYIDDQKNNIVGDLYVTGINAKVKTFPKPQKMEEPVNSDDLEFEGFMNQEGTTVIVASDRKGGQGLSDLYMLKKLPDGRWSAAMNLGPNINTPYDENFPVFDEENRILYFSSRGHTNMGGYDIFKSKYNPENNTFSPAVNIGYPINTPEDNMEFTLAGKGRDGYISAVRKEGYGDLDVYRVIFNDVEERPTVLRGKVSTGDSLQAEINAEISIIDAKTKEDIDIKNVNPKNGKYVFVMEPGKYILKVACEGYEDYQEEFTVFDKSDYIFELEKNVRLRKPGEIIAPPVKPGPAPKGKPAPKK